jgi:hypothetical protein
MISSSSQFVEPRVSRACFLFSHTLAHAILLLALSLTGFLCGVCRVIRAPKLDMQLTRLGEGLPSLRPCLGHLEAVPRLGVGL